MTFASFGNPVSHLIFDQANEIVQIGTITPGRNATIDRLHLFFYKQGAITGNIRLYLVVSGKTFYSDTISLSLISGNQIGRVRFSFNPKPILTASTGYALYAQLTSYTPTLTEVPENDQYFSVMRDYPVTMAYDSSPTSRTSTPIALHLIESV